MVAWLIRLILGLAVVVVTVLALYSRQAAQPAPVPPTAEPASVPLPTRATSEPFVERVVSRVARETQAPYPTATPLPDGVVQVSVVDFGYMPGVVRIHAGQTVIWRNDGREEHDVTGDDWHSGPLEPSTAYRQTFGVVGTSSFRCSIHPDMVGTLIVDR